ncbi:MAG TPA: amino acid deaminase/aldolase [Chloroflexia bacterium]|nr:amino acid deaminase/aldolase [Chloroflexia bacterium]
MPSYQAYRNIFKDIPLPFAYVDLDLLDQNICQIKKRAGSKQIRIASKSIRCLSVLKRILQADPVYQGVMCYSPPEAVYLSQQGLDDLLVAYPCWQAEQVRIVCAEVRKGKNITLMVDSIEHVRHLERLAGEEDVTLSLCLDLDLSADYPGLHFGVWRSSIFKPEDALRVFLEISKSPHLRLDGLMGYEAQIAGVGDRVPGQFLKNKLINTLKKHSVREIATKRAAAVNLLKASGANLRFVNGGGTGSLETTGAEEVVTEITAGSGFYSPVLFDHYQAFKHLPAAGFALEITRKPKPAIYTCAGGGYIASGATAPEKQPQPYLPACAKLFSLEGAGEVQTPVRYNGPEQLNLGDPIFMRHSKAGELCERFNSLYLISQGQIVDTVPTYRGEGYCFL